MCGEVVLILFLAFNVSLFAQEKKQEKKYEVTTTVKEQRAKGYPMNVLEELPVVKGCESLASSQRHMAKCMKDQINFLFKPFMEGAEKVSKGNGVNVYIEFIINQDGTISDVQRLKVSEEDLDEFVRDAFSKFRAKVNKEKIFVKPGRVYDRDVNTLYGVKYMQAFKKKQKL